MLVSRVWAAFTAVRRVWLHTCKWSPSCIHYCKESLVARLWAESELCSLYAEAVCCSVPWFSELYYDILGKFREQAFSPSNVRSDTNKVSPMWLSKPRLESDDANGMPRCPGISPQGLSLTRRAIDSWGVPGAGEVVVPEEQHTNCLSSAEQSAHKTFIKIILDWQDYV